MTTMETIEVINKYEKLCDNYVELIEKHKKMYASNIKLMEAYVKALEEVLEDPFNKEVPLRLEGIINSMMRIIQHHIMSKGAK